jgi:ABC-type dipeptide/oligopeptide/nickel transport system permease subunit
MFGDRSVSVPGIARAGLRLPPVAQNVVKFARRKPLGALGAAWMVAVIMIALLAGVISPHDPYDIYEDDVQHPPSKTYPLGTDNLGQDVLSRIFYGARISLYVSGMAVLLGVTTGFLLGILTAYVGGAFDLLFQRLVDAMIAFPTIILAMAIMAVLGASVNNVIMALVFVLIAPMSRAVRSQVLSLKEMDYVLSARALGCSPARIMLRHILPNCLAIYMIMATITLGSAIIAEASLSFLGIGVPAGTATWGGMLTSATQQHIKTAPWVAIAPGVAISMVVFSVNWLGDALRDVLDPRLRGAR